MSDSMHRFRRVEELLDSAGRVSVASTACILRDMRGEGGKSVGYCNELAINQLLAMHSVIFRPEERKYGCPLRLGSVESLSAMIWKRYSILIFLLALSLFPMKFLRIHSCILSHSGMSWSLSA